MLLLSDTELATSTLWQLSSLSVKALLHRQVIAAMSDWNSSALWIPLKSVKSCSVFQMSLGHWKVWKLLVNSTLLSQEKWLTLMLPLQTTQGSSINLVIKMVRCCFYLSIQSATWMLAVLLVITDRSVIPSSSNLMVWRLKIEYVEYSSSPIKFIA